MSFLSTFHNPRIVESVFRDAWLGLYLHHTRPVNETRPAASFEEAHSRLEQFVIERLACDYLTPDGPLADVYSDLQRLFRDIGTPECLEHLKSVQGLYSPRREQNQCSDKVWAYLAKLGYRGKRPDPHEARRLIAKLRR